MLAVLESHLTLPPTRAKNLVIGTAPAPSAYVHNLRNFLSFRSPMMMDFSNTPARGHFAAFHMRFAWPNLRYTRQLA
jgi:hypothetical protein